MTNRKMMDCRKMKSDTNCDLVMSGSERHLIPAGIAHAITAHGEKDTPELREQITKALEDEPS